MAYRIPNSDTTLSSTTGWDTNANTPTLHATTNTNINTTARFTGTFTAPNTTNKSTGVLFFCVTNASTAYTVTLQENTVDTAATVTILGSQFANNHWVYFRFPTPYTYTTTAAGAYRFKVSSTVATSTFASDSGAVNYAFIGTSDVTGAIGSSDILFVQGENGSTTRTVTLDGTMTFGNYGTIAITSVRALDNALVVSKNGVVQADTAASSNITVKGNTVVVSGEFRAGTVATPLPSGVNFTYTTDSVLAGDQHGTYIYNGARYILQGAVKSGWKANYVSGLGTAASPMITTGDIGGVGDEILVSPTGNDANNYAQTEYRYIITKNSTTSYVLSATSGGAESALAFTHSNKAWVLNLQRNIVIKGGSNISYVSNSNTTVGNFDVDWARFEKMGSSTAGKLGVQVARSTGMFGNIDYSVVTGATHYGFNWTTSKYPTSHTGLIATRGTAANVVGAIGATGANSKSFTDCFAINNTRVGFHSTGFNMSFTNCFGIANNTIGSAIPTTTGGFYLTGSGTLSNCGSHCNRSVGMTLGSAAFDVSNSHIGDYGTNTVDISLLVDSSINVSYINTTFGSATLHSGQTGMLPGSEVRFHNLNQTTNNHIWYTPFGDARATGSGLGDTTVRTPGSLAVRISPLDIDDGFTWSFNIPAKAFSQVVFNGRFIKNTAMGADVATVSLFLPGATTAAATTILSNTYIETPGAIWDGVVLNANNTQSTDGLATIVVNAKTITANAYIYMDDFYNAGDTITNNDKVTGLDTWDRGKPIDILSPQVLNINDIWNYPTAALTTNGTVGKNVKDLLTTDDYMGLK